MSQTRLEAHHENQTYYFYLVNKSSDKISINAYSTDYNFCENRKRVGGMQLTHNSVLGLKSTLHKLHERKRELETATRRVL